MNEHEYKVGDKFVITDHPGHDYKIGTVYTVEETGASDGDGQWVRGEGCDWNRNVRYVKPHVDIDALKDAVVEAARKYLDEYVDSPTWCKVAFREDMSDAIKALDKATRKTPEQLQQERNDAADALAESVVSWNNFETMLKYKVGYSEAKAAHEEALKHG